jgi:hypothetical protein
MRMRIIQRGSIRVIDERRVSHADCHVGSSRTNSAPARHLRCAAHWLEQRLRVEATGRAQTCQQR